MHEPEPELCDIDECGVILLPAVRIVLTVEGASCSHTLRRNNAGSPERKKEKRVGGSSGTLQHGSMTPPWATPILHRTEVRIHLTRLSIACPK